MPENIYESDRLVREYLLFHYGAPHEVLPHRGGPHDALGFAVRCVDELIDARLLPPEARALDLGCAVGRSAFELASHCREVVALDCSRAFIEAAEKIRKEGFLDYLVTVEGFRTMSASARRPEGVDSSRIRFAVGDAMDLPQELGGFDVVLAANLLCRLPDPRAFIARLPSLVKRGGQLLLTTPFTWLEEFTPAEKWIGGSGDEVGSEALQKLLAPDFELAFSEDLPFLIREHARKFQWSVAWGTRWIRR